jgi:hypothetical protein
MAIKHKKTVTAHPSFLLAQESIRIAVNAGSPDGFLLAQE